MPPRVRATSPSFNGALLVAQPYRRCQPLARPRRAVRPRTAEPSRPGGHGRGHAGHDRQHCPGPDHVGHGRGARTPPQHGTGRQARPAGVVRAARRTVGRGRARPGTCEVALVNARGDVLDAVDLKFDADAATPDARRQRGRERAHAGPAVQVGRGAWRRHRRAGHVRPQHGRVLGSGQLPGLRGTSSPSGFRPRSSPADARQRRTGAGVGREVVRRRPRRGVVRVGADGPRPWHSGSSLDGTILPRRRGATRASSAHTCVVANGGERCRCGLGAVGRRSQRCGWLRAEAAARRIQGARSLDAHVCRGKQSTSPVAADLLDRYADNLAIGLANLVTLVARPGSSSTETRSAVANASRPHRGRPARPGAGPPREQVELLLSAARPARRPTRRRRPGPLRDLPPRRLAPTPRAAAAAADVDAYEESRPPVSRPSATQADSAARSWRRHVISRRRLCRGGR